MINVFKRLDELKIGSVLQFIERIENKSVFEELQKQSQLEARNLIRVLRYLHRWYLPKKKYVSQLVVEVDDTQKQQIKLLRENGIRYNLDALEKGRTKKGRERISSDIDIPEEFILELVVRSDLSRIPYSSKKTVTHFYNMGFDRLDRLAETNPEDLPRILEEYSEGIGMDIRHGVDLPHAREIARVLPKVVKF